MQKGKRQPIYSNLSYRNLGILVYLYRSIKVDCTLLHERHVREKKIENKNGKKAGWFI